MTRFIVAILIKSQHKFIIWNLAIYIFQTRLYMNLPGKKNLTITWYSRQWALCSVLCTPGVIGSIIVSREIYNEFLPPGMVTNLWNCCAALLNSRKTNCVWMWEINFNIRWISCTAHLVGKILRLEIKQNEEFIGIVYLPKK